MNQPRDDGSAAAPRHAPSAQTLALRVAGIAVMLVLAGLLVMWGMDLAHRFGMWRGDHADDQLAMAGLQARISSVTVERDALVAARRSAAPLAAEAQQQIKTLLTENGKLRGDLDLVESLMPADAAGAGLVLRAVRADLVAPDQLHYVVLLGFGASKKQTIFNGDMQLAVTLKKGDTAVVLQFPQENGADADRYRIAVSGYQRFDGQLTLPPGTEAAAIEVRLLEQGRVVARQGADVTPLPSGTPSTPAAPLAAEAR